MKNMTLAKIIAGAAIALSAFFLGKKAYDTYKFDTYRLSLYECVWAERNFRKNPSPQNRQNYEDRQKSFQKIDKEYKDIDYNTDWNTIARAFAKTGYYIDKPWIPFSEPQKFYPMNMGRIIEKGEFEFKESGKKMSYILYANEIYSTTEANIETDKERQRIYSINGVFAAVNNTLIRNEARNEYRSWLKGRKERRNNPESIDRLRDKVCGQVFSEIRKKGGEVSEKEFDKEYTRLAIPESMYHEEGHALNGGMSFSEVRPFLYAIIHSDSWLTLELIEELLLSTEKNKLYKYEEHCKSALYISEELGRQGFSRDKICNADLKKIQAAAQKIYDNYDPEKINKARKGPNIIYYGNF